MHTPKSTTTLFEGDQVIMYGREPLLRKIITRPAGQAGDEEHHREVENQRRSEGKATGDDKKPTILKTVKSIFRRKK